MKNSKKAIKCRDELASVTIKLSIEKEDKEEKNENVI